MFRGGVEYGEHARIDFLAWVPPLTPFLLMIVSVRDIVGSSPIARSTSQSGRNVAQDPLHSAGLKLGLLVRRIYLLRGANSH